MRRTIPNLVQRLAHDQAGTAITEGLVACIVGVVVMGAALTLYLVTVRGESATAARSEVLARGIGGMERMIRELRQGTSVVSSTPRTIVFETYVRALTPPQRRVRYDCSAGDACLRSVAATGTSSFGAATTFIEGLDPAPEDPLDANDDIFTYSGAVAGIRTRPEVAVRLRLERSTDEAGSRSLAAGLSDAVTLRNATPLP